jgi:Cytosol aminopeptidase family, N-terminal domain
LNDLPALLSLVAPHANKQMIGDAQGVADIFCVHNQRAMTLVWKAKHCPWFVLLLAAVSVQAQSSTSSTTTPIAESSVLTVSNASFPVDVLVESPAVTKTDLQAICLFQSDPSHTFHGSLMEIDQKLGGLLSQIHKSNLFSGAVGETLLIAPKPGTIPARRLLLIGLGDLESFTPEREQQVGFIFFGEAERLGISHPYFAPTVLDGGKTGTDTGDVAQQFLSGFLRAKSSQDLLRNAGVSAGASPRSLTYLAGRAHAADTRDGLARAFKTMPTH